MLNRKTFFVSFFLRRDRVMKNIQMLALSDAVLAEAFAAYKEGLKKKIVKANEELKEVKFEYKTN